jgi:hypothetical protein
MGAILIISQGLTAVATLGPIAVSLALQIKALLQSGDGSFDVQVHALQDGTIKNLDESDALIKAWLATHPE